MNATQQQVQMAAKLYEIRDTAKMLLGDRYAAKMADLGKLLKMTADRDKKEPLAVATDVCKKKGLQGMDMLLIMSAAVELAEPSMTPNVVSEGRAESAACSESHRL